MTRYVLAAGVAALAIAAPAASAPHGGGHGQQKQSQKEAQHHAGGGGHAKAQKARGGDNHAQKADRGHVQKTRQAQARPQHGHAQKTRQAAARSQHGHAQKTRQAEARPQHGHAQKVRQAEARQQRGHSARTAEIRQKSNHQVKRDMRQAERSHANGQREVRRELAHRNDLLGRNNAPVMSLRDARDLRERRIRTAERRDYRNFGWDDIPVRGRAVSFADGCPPGLARKPVACMPPGLANQFVGVPLSTVRERVLLNELPNRLRYVYADTPDYYYRYGNGYMYRVNRESQLISGLMPLFGLGYTVGQQFPAAYSNYYLPSAYQPFYPATPYSNYRYANGYVYQVNPYTGLIADVDPLLGYGYGYGQMMPLSYSVYNVPYQYRPLYYDTSDYYYRYAPGAIYQVDPTTSLITAVAALLSPGLTVGQPMPMGYSAYNVPYGYRASYYDTPDSWYRYANGNIYRVDPTTQLVTALVAAALT